ncbi:MAG TPA: class I SAM-dependent methyltransferase [Opitutaceae bacterium]|nr:class I SAM-dependent methyltransferase [Opitutaceae bacterium]
MTDPLPPDLPQRNKQAWDRLYARTRSLIWGRAPVGFLAACLDRLAPVGPADRVLDAATGEGRNLPALRRLGGRLHACEASAEALRKIDPELRAGVELANCDLRALPYADHAFAFILLSDVVETLPDLDAALAEIVRVLAPDGRLLCNIPGLDDGIAGQEMRPLGANRFLYQDRYFYQFLEPAAARALLERHGLRIELEETCRWSEPPHPGFRAVAHEHVSRVFLARRPARPPP